MKRRKYNYPNLNTDREKKIIASFLNGDITTREAGKALGISHQNVVNLVSSLARKWYQDNNILRVY